MSRGRYSNYVGGGDEFGNIHISDDGELILTFWANLNNIRSLVGGENFRENCGGESENVHWEDDIDVIQKITVGQRDGHFMLRLYQIPVFGINGNFTFGIITGVFVSLTYNENVNLY